MIYRLVCSHRKPIPWPHVRQPAVELRLLARGRIDKACRDAKTCLLTLDTVRGILKIEGISETADFPLAKMKMQKGKKLCKGTLQ